MTYAEIVPSPEFPTYNIWPNKPFDVPASERTATTPNERHFEIRHTLPFSFVLGSPLLIDRPPLALHSDRRREAARLTCSKCGHIGRQRCAPAAPYIRPSGPCRVSVGLVYLKNRS